MKTTLLTFLTLLLTSSIVRSQESELDKILKGTNPKTLRYIKAKTESWSELAPDQIIAQKTIKPIIAHAGYEPNSPKFAVIWTNNIQYTGQFEIIDLLNNNQPPKEPIVYTGNLKSYGNHIWGGNNLIADFSDFKKPGFYKIRLKLDQNSETTDSYSFEIREGLYQELATKASDWFNYQLCGVKVEGWYDACHLDDAKLHGNEKSLTGGWHDAGDYNKWPIYTPSPLYALSMYQDVFTDKDIPNFEKVRNNLAWELSFLCKAQKEDGTFYSIISSEEKPWIWAGTPENEPQRVAVNYNVGNGDPRDAAHCIQIAAGVLKAASTLKGSHPALIDSCLKLAHKPYERVQALNYNKESQQQERNDYLSIQSGILGCDLGFWNLTGNKKYLKDAEKRVKILLEARNVEGRFYSNYEKTWTVTHPNLHMTTLYEYYRLFPNSEYSKNIEKAFIQHADFFLAHTAKTPFANAGVFHGQNYSLITDNKSAGFNSWAFAVAYSFSQNTEHLKMAIDNLNWILGFNPADVSMMAGVGVGPGAYHHRYTSIPGHQDGIVPGGVLNGIKAGDGNLLFLGDEGAENYVIGYNLPVDYPAIDTDVKGWTYAWWPNEYHIPNNAYFIMAATQLADVLN